MANSVDGTALGEGGGHVADKNAVLDVCPYCGSTQVRRLGYCNVCDRLVCERCGNMHIVGGERRVTHSECTRKDGDSFSMIKFVD